MPHMLAYSALWKEGINLDKRCRICHFHCPFPRGSESCHCSV